MANLQNIRRRIRSVKNIQKITNAMDMIARSRFNAARDALLMNLPYVDKTRSIIRNLMSQMQGQEAQSPFIMTRKQMIEQEELGNGKFLLHIPAMFSKKRTTLSNTTVQKNLQKKRRKKTFIRKISTRLRTSERILKPDKCVLQEVMLKQQVLPNQKQAAAQIQLQIFLWQKNITTKIMLTVSS